MLVSRSGWYFNVSFAYLVLGAFLYLVYLKYVEGEKVKVKGEKVKKENQPNCLFFKDLT